jgi:hypothetical protein
MRRSRLLQMARLTSQMAERRCGTNWTMQADTRCEMCEENDMVSAATRKRRLASYIGAGIVPPDQGGGAGPTPIEPTSAYSFDFANKVYSGPDGAIANPFASAFTHSRASEILAPDSAGRFHTFAAGVPAITDLGLTLRQADATNLLINSKMAGKVAGTPGTPPTGWTIGAVPAGVTRSIGATTIDPVTGLEVTDVVFSGTATANGTLFIPLVSSFITGLVPADLIMMSAYLSMPSGEFPNNDNMSAIKLIGQFGNASGGGLGNAVVGEDRLFNRDTTPRRIRCLCDASTVLTAAQLPTMGSFSPRIRITFKSGSAYNFTLRVGHVQVEKLANANEDASLPIPTTTAAVTHLKDEWNYGPELIAVKQGEAWSTELTTARLRGSSLHYRVERPMLVANGNAKVLTRLAQGEISSDFAPAAKSGRSYRTQYGWRQKHMVQSRAGKFMVASTSPAEAKEVTANAPAVASMSVVVDGTVAKLDINNGYRVDTAEFTEIDVDVAVYGATSGGIVAAASATINGSSTVVAGVEREVMPGGLTTGGLAMLDLVGNAPDVYGSMALDALKWCNEYYGFANPYAKAIECRILAMYFDNLIAKHRIRQVYGNGAVAVQKTGARVRQITCRNGQKIRGRQWMDDSYEIRLSKMAGVSTVSGREAANADNPYNGNLATLPFTSTDIGANAHQFIAPLSGGLLNIDPYKVPGDPSSGLVFGVQSYPVGTQGEADAALQAYCFRMTVVRDTSEASLNSRKVPFPTEPPPGYSAATYELLGRYMKAMADAGYVAVHINNASPPPLWYKINHLLLIVQTAGTYDLNNNNGFSIDGIGMNWGEGWNKIMTDAGIANPSASYSSASVEECEIYRKWQMNFQYGLMYYLQHDPDARIPLEIRQSALLFGLDNKHYLDPNDGDPMHWPYSLYIREDERILGVETLEWSDVMALDETPLRFTDTLGMLSYDPDSHHVRRYVDTSTGSPRVINEGNFYNSIGGNKKAPVSFRMTLPKPNECENLSVGFGISARHTGFGAARMELTFMALAEAGAIAASEQAKAGASARIHDIDYEATLRPKLLSRGLVVDQVN